MRQGKRNPKKLDPKLSRLLNITTTIFWDVMGRHFHKHSYIHKNESLIKAMAMRIGERKHPLSVCDQRNASS
jgi:hypothetical protein